MKDSNLQRVTEIEHFLNRLNEEELRLLNRMVVERLKLFHKARDLQSLAKFNIMDRVYFVHNEQRITGIVIKLNRRSVTVRGDDEHHHTWNISPAFLMRIAE